MSFKNIKGQDRPIEVLQGYVRESRLKGSYLFTGPEGVGKKMAALALAKAVNCSEEGFDACDRCASCLKINNNQHPDVHLIDAEGAEIKIEEVRQLQKAINLKPYEGKFSIFIINNAHDLTSEASNALLKILEEPPEKSLIILLSDKPGLIFKTIISRCKILKFLPMGRAGLKGILQKEHGLDINRAHFLAYFSEGRIGQALKLKDTDVLREKNRVIDQLAIAHKVDFGSLPLQNKEQVKGYLNVLASWFRDIYLIKIGMPQDEVINFDRKGELLKIMAKFSYLDLNEILDYISNAIAYLEQNINVRLLLYNLEAKIWKG